MTQDQIDDLKDFIDTTVTNKTRVVVTEVIDEILDRKLEEKFDLKLLPIHQKIDDLLLFVAESISESNDALGEQIQDHEQRITFLEQIRAT